MSYIIPENEAVAQRESRAAKQSSSAAKILNHCSGYGTMIERPSSLSKRAAVREIED
jgi:hypothetical protein